MMIEESTTVSMFTHMIVSYRYYTNTPTHGPRSLTDTHTHARSYLCPS